MMTDLLMDDDDLVNFDPDEYESALVESIEPVKTMNTGPTSTGATFTDFLLKPELLRAIVDAGFEHPSEGMSQGVRVGN